MFGLSGSVAQTEPAQQSALLPQPVALRGMHAPHLPALHERPRQQSVDAPHAPPDGMHLVHLLLPRHSSLAEASFRSQHCPSLSQVAPCVPHSLGHLKVAVLHMPEQHMSESPQLTPGPLHTRQTPGGLHATAEPAWSTGQQSVDALHVEAPRAMQADLVGSSGGDDVVVDRAASGPASFCGEASLDLSRTDTSSHAAKVNAPSTREAVARAILPTRIAPWPSRAPRMGDRRVRSRAPWPAWPRRLR